MGNVSNKRYNCGTCGKVYRNRYFLNQHVQWCERAARRNGEQA